MVFLLGPPRPYRFVLLLLAAETGLVASFSFNFHQTAPELPSVVQELTRHEQSNVSFVPHAPLDDATPYRDPRTEVLSDTPPSPEYGETTAGSGGLSQLVSLSLCALILGVVISHEAVVAYNGRLPCSDGLSENTRRQGVQCSYFLMFVLIMMDPAVLIPTSYELAKEMDCSAAVSGLFVGAGFLTTPIGSIGGGMVFRYCRPATTRIVAIVGVFMMMAQCLIMALTLDSQPEHGPDSMWFLILVRSILGVGKVCLIMQQLTYNVTPNSEKVTLGLFFTVAVNLGLCLGPFLAATTIHMMGGREVVPSVFSRTSAQVYWMAALWAICALLFVLTIPVDYSELAESAKSTDAEKARSEPNTKRDQIPVEDRKSIVFHGLLFNIERAFTSRAIEAGSAMLLETQFGWSTRTIGFSISGVFATTIALCVMIKLQLDKGLFKDVNAMVGFTLIGCLGAALLYDFHNGVAVQILVADLLMYPFMFAASGITDGLVTKVAVPNSWYSQESYLGAKVAATGITSFFAYPVTRYILESGGRNSYASFMFLMGGLGSISCLKMAWLIEWKGNDQKPLGSIA